MKPSKIIIQPMSIICILALLIVPIVVADSNQLYQQNTADISITLYDNSNREFFVNSSLYTISGTNALTALLVAADQEDYSYNISDEYYEIWSSFLVTSLNGIENEGWDGWQYWVNFPEQDIPMVSANDHELKDGDELCWFYGGYGVNPETSDHIITIQISIQTDENIPTLTLTKPEIGGIYLNDNKIFSLPFISSSVIINPIIISVDAEDTESGISNVTFAIDDTIKNTCYNEPFMWNFEPTGFFQKVTLTITVCDRSNHKQSIQQPLLLVK